MAIIFYLKEGKDGKEPNNWRSYFGGSVWEKLPGQENLYYYHAYAKRAAGFKLGKSLPCERKSTRWSTGGLTAASQASGLTRSSTLKRPDLGRSSGGRAGRQRLFNQQHHPDAEARRRDENGIGVFFKRIKGTLLLRPHDAFTVGEVFEVDREQLEEFIGEDGYFSTMFAFDPIQSYKKGTCQCEFDRNMNPDEWKRDVFVNQKLLGNIAFEANIIENHDMAWCDDLYPGRGLRLCQHIGACRSAGAAAWYAVFISGTGNRHDKLSLRIGRH